MENKDHAHSPQLALLKKHFANCFDKQGSFIPAKLEEIVQDSGVALSKEGYSLNWLGKSYARLLANEHIRTRLVADTAHNENPANAASQNLLIKGDNLEVLKHLMGAYSEQVKMIYIDPPYNTGSDGFVYQDDRKFTVAQLSSLAGIDEDQARRILEFTSSKSNSHSAWLTFMYPRLYLARQLLRDDGVIFISIDDNEQAQLKVLCDEVFGEENFVSELIWQKKTGAGAKSKGFIGLHEYVLCYAKNITLNWDVIAPLTDKTRSMYNKRDEHFEKLGPYATWPLDTTSMDERANLRFPIINNGKEIWPKKQWLWSKSRVEKAQDENKLIFNFNEKNNAWNVRFKGYLFDETGEEKLGKPTSVLVGPYTQEGTKNFQEYFERDIFPFPKPVGLISKLIGITVEVGKPKRDEIFLDFFGGSGTTAEAVMQMNAEDGGNRQFICVQIDEKIDAKSAAYQAGYLSIFDITQARISKAAAKIKADLEKSTIAEKRAAPEKSVISEKTVISAQAGIQLEFASCNKMDSRLRGNDEVEACGTDEVKACGDDGGVRGLDLGFKVFAALPMFDKYQDAPEELTENLELFDVNTLSPDDRHSLMLTWAVRDGIKLGTPLSPVSLGGYPAYRVANLLYFIEPGISLDAVVALLEQLDHNPDFAPSRLVVLGYLLDSKAQREMTEALQHYNNRKGIALTLDIRFN